MPRLVWNYSGPRGPGIAKHFAKHVAEFLEREVIADATVEALEPSSNSGQVIVTLKQSDADAVAKALRPHVQEP